MMRNEDGLVRVLQRGALPGSPSVRYISYAHAQTTVMASNRQRTSSNAGENALKALHVLRQSGVGTVQAARLDAVSKSLALGDPTDKSPDDVVGRLTLDAETARRLVDAIGLGRRRSVRRRRRWALTRATPSRRLGRRPDSLLEFARLWACDGASLLLEAGFVPAAVASHESALGAPESRRCRVSSTPSCSLTLPRGVEGQLLRGDPLLLHLGQVFFARTR